MSGTNHWLSLDLGEKLHLCKEIRMKEKGLFGKAAFLPLHVIFVFMFVFAVFPRRLLTGSMPFGPHVTIILEQPSQLSLSLRWELDRAWSGLRKHSMGKHFLTSARARCSNSCIWIWKCQLLLSGERGRLSYQAVLETSMVAVLQCASAWC